MQYITNLKEDTLEVDLIGRFTFNDSDSFRRLLTVISKPEIRNVSFQMSNTQFVDSAALGMFLIAKDETEKLGTKIVFFQPQGYVKKIFEISKFYSIFDVRD